MVERAILEHELDDVVNRRQLIPGHMSPPFSGARGSGGTARPEGDGSRRAHAPLSLRFGLI